MRRGETIQAYALRLKGLSRGLPECAFEEVVKQRFVSSNTPSMRKDTALVSEALDVVVSNMVQLKAINAVAGGTGALRTKRVGEVVGAVWTRGRSDQDIYHAQQSDDQRESVEAVGMILPDRVEPTYDMSLALHEEIVAIANERCPRWDTNQEPAWTGASERYIAGDAIGVDTCPTLSTRVSGHVRIFSGNAPSR
jgi:hypothetical protein